MGLIECRHAVDIKNLLNGIFRFYLAIKKTGIRQTNPYQACLDSIYDVNCHQY